MPSHELRCQEYGCRPPGRHGLAIWFSQYSYPLWRIWSGEDPGWPVGAAFLLFLLVLCYSAAVAATPVRTTFWPSFWDQISAIVGALTGVAAAVAAIHGIRIGLFALFFFIPVVRFASVAVVLLPFLLVTVTFLSLVVAAGIMGNRTEDSLREDMARFRALAFISSLLWLGFTGCSLFGPPLFEAFLKTHALAKSTTLVSGWLATTLGGVFAGKSAKTPAKNSSSDSNGSGALNVLVAAGPPVFVIGLLLLVAMGVQAGLSIFCPPDRFLPALFLTGGLGLFASFIGFRLDINDFSMHAFYRNRIARCYAGATCPNRRPDRFTGFAKTDSQFKVSDLLPDRFTVDPCAATQAQGEPPDKYKGPFPIFCTSINLTFGEDLAWQERKAASFIFTPLYSGYSVGFTSEHLLDKRPMYTYNGFTRTRDYPKPGGSIGMHSAVAISGAAISPNWGYHTNPSMAFLLTMFNVRLGWWILNPRLTSGNYTNSLINGLRRPASPPFPLYNLLSELIGRATDTSPYVYLSDGGHFDNMGLYELVRRRCRRILICDAEQDPKDSFEGIGMAIRKARVDFGVEITLNLRNLDPRVVDPSVVPAPPLTRTHYLKGTIRYPEDRPGTPAGIVLYIKASLTGDEPGDVLNYKRQHDAFLHEATTDQWFSESQFESYRRLGYHIVVSDPMPSDTAPRAGSDSPDAPLAEALMETGSFWTEHVR